MRGAPLAIALALGLARGDEPTPVRVGVGGAVNVCETGLAHCPISTSLCDEPEVALIENGPDGAVLRGVSPGTTLCSLLGYEGAFRRVLRVTVEGKR